MVKTLLFRIDARVYIIPNLIASEFKAWNQQLSDDLAETP